MSAPRMKMSVGPSSSSAPVQEVTAFTNATLTLSLYAGPVLSFGAPGLSPAALLLSGLASDVWVYKNGAAWQRVRVMPIGQTWGPSGEDDVTVNAVGYRQVVEARHIISSPPTFTGIDQGTIVWNLIQHTQAQTAGDLGITAGTILTGVTRDRTEYKIGDNLGTILGALTKVQAGVWYDIDAAKVLTCKLFSAFTTRTDPIVLGANARSAIRNPSTVAFANVGGAIGSAVATVPAWSSAPTLATDPRGRWETFDSTHSSVIVQAQVAEYAQGLVTDRALPPYAWTFDIDPAAFFEGSSNYDVGEFVPVVVPRSAVDEIATPPITVTVQVTSVVVAWDDANKVTVTVSGVEV